MAIEIRRFTNQAFGFPRGHIRRIKPVALACIHITGNNRTGKRDEGEPGAGARDEWNFANRRDSNGPSAHLYVARDGSGIEAIDPARFAAWSNGDVMSPSPDNPGIDRVLRMRNKGYNANEAYWEEIECVGGSQFPLTDAQIETVSRRVAQRALLTGLPISRETVHGHWEINGINRQNCPAPKAVHFHILDRIVERANAVSDSLRRGGEQTEGAGQPGTLPPDTTEPKQPNAPGAGPSPTVFKFGGKPRVRGEYNVVVAVARQRSSPFVQANNLVGRLPLGARFHVHQTTDEGQSVGGSRRWFGNREGSVWMHSSVIRPVKVH